VERPQEGLLEGVLSFNGLAPLDSGTTGDLGEIEKFGEHNWYVEGATILLDKQQGDGGWAGGYVNTSFAVFFLTRATRLKPYSAPKILTNSPAGGGSADRDLVFIGRLNGFISAKEVLKILGDSRNANMVSVGEEVVRNYNQNFVGELAPVLLSLWTGSSDKVSRFARTSLQQITGLSSSARNDYADWYASFEKIDALSTGPGVNAAALSSLLKNTASPTLKGKILDLAHRNKLYQMAGDLVGELAISKSHDYRLKVNGLLNLWSGRWAHTTGLPGLRWQRIRTHLVCSLGHGIRFNNRCRKRSLKRRHNLRRQRRRGRPDKP